ncbi:MAG: polysaccharide deacetylase family protein [Gemmatimonadaceae bacterium]
MKNRAFLAALVVAAAPAAAAPCAGTVYLTFDTGHMEPAEAIANVLDKHQVKATFFLANEKTRRGDTSLDPSWAPFWKRLAQSGHAFGSHTWRHWYFAGDTARGRIRYAPMGGTQGELLDAAALCAELKKPEEAFRAMTGRGFDGLWRAPGGRITPMAVEYARGCGFTHAGWTPAGFSGDELPSDRFPSDKLIERQLRDIKDGDILLWHLGIWSRQDPLWLQLDRLVAGLKSKGLCFARLTDDRKWMR